MLLIYGGLLAGGHWGGGWLIDYVGMDLDSGEASHGLHMMAAGVVLFAVLLAIPFVPGVEISVALLALFGSKVAIAIYCATVVALALAWLVGRVLPITLIAALFGSLGLHRAHDFVERLRPLGAAERLAVLTEHAPRRIIPMLLKHRYVAVIVALNVPGNAVIGGGGGIALLAGLSGLFSFPRFLASVSLAALPVPLFVMLMGG